MTDPIRPLHLVPDRAHHAVTGYAQLIAASAGCAVASQAPPPSETPLHLHFTDRLWGISPAAAAATFSQLARHHQVSVTLHDLPQASDGPASERRRAAAYAEVVHLARAVACNSAWETELLSAFAVPRQPPVVIPLAVAPLSQAPPRTAAATQTATVGLLGFIYPGKGHAEAIDAAALCARSLGRSVAVIAIGAASDGHQADAEALSERARQRAVPFSVTGFLSGAELCRRARQVDVPLAAHRHLSASASIGSWLSAGRRPLVADCAYAREIDALRPGTIRRYDPDDLSEAITGALADPHAGWLTADVDLRPGPAETAAAYLHWWTEQVVW
jgi:glycosyltransferase involved in cell wall biosynthesis